MDNKAILNACEDNEFFGRTGELEEICRYATSPLKPVYGICVTGNRWIGKTELFKRVYCRLYRHQDRIVPVYYRFKCGSGVEDFAGDYLMGFIKHYIAFVKKSPDLAIEDVPATQLERLLKDMELGYLSRLLTLHREAKKSGDRGLLLRNALNAPHQTALHANTPIFLMLDDFDCAGNIHLYEGGTGILRECLKTLASGSLPYAVTGRARGLFEGEDISPGSMKAMELTGLGAEASLGLMQELSERYGVDYDSEILAAAAIQLEGNPAYIKSIIASARRHGKNLETIRDFIDIYTAELIDGGIGFSLNAAVAIKSLNAMRILRACINVKNGISEEAVIEETALDGGEVRKLIPGLDKLYLLDARSGLIKWAGDGVMKDYINYLYETEVNGRPKDEVKTRIAKERLKEGFSVQGEKASGEMKAEVQSLLKMFNGQAVPKILFRNHDFLARYGGRAYGYGKEDEIAEDEKIILPQIVGCFNHAHLSASAQAGQGQGEGENRISTIVGCGFDNGTYDDEHEVVWIVGVKESPASAVHTGEAEGFIRQCAIIANNIKAPAARRCMIGKEGFTGEALKRLTVEGVYTMDAAQLRILKNLIEGREVADKSTVKGLASLKEFEVILPMSAKAELVAAGAVEEIGIAMGLDSDTIARIKTALVEACINAFEHSRVKNGKVYCRFIAGSDRLILNIQNEGRDFESALQPATGDTLQFARPSQRGRGIELMRQLMDEVRFEKIRGGTKLVMVKYIKRNGETAHG